MAERLDNYDFTGRSRQGSKYDRYLDGGIYRLVRGEDIGQNVSSARTQLHKRAKEQGLRIRTATEGDAAIVVQAFPRDDA
jgi:predicted type IV restriction endonuclease